MGCVARSGQALSTLLSNVPVRIAVAVVVAQQILLGQLLVLRNLQGLVHVRQEVLRDLWRELQETLWGWGCEEVVGSARQQALTRSRRVGAGEVQGQSSAHLKVGVHPARRQPLQEVKGRGQLLVFRGSHQGLVLGLPCGLPGEASRFFLSFGRRSDREISYMGPAGDRQIALRESDRYLFRTNPFARCNAPGAKWAP